MEGAGKLVDDEELREAMSEKGLGTPATRASVIEGLIFEDYLHRNGRELQPTAKAFDLFYALSRFGVDELRSPELTGDWEFKLKQMEQGRLPREEFMDHIVEMTQDLVDRIKSGTTIDEPLSTLAEKCPKCGGTVKENYKKFQCTNCDFSMWKVIASRRIENEEVEELFRERSIGPLQNFRSRMGRPFAAMLKLKDEFTVEFDFGQGGPDDRDAEPVDFSGKSALGPCPKCGAHVFDHELAYVCEKSVGPARTCDFRTGKIILQRPDRARADASSCSPRARPTCCTGSFPRRAARSRRSWCASPTDASGSSSRRAKPRRRRPRARRHRVRRIRRPKPLHPR